MKDLQDLFKKHFWPGIHYYEDEYAQLLFLAFSSKVGVLMGEILLDQMDLPESPIERIFISAFIFNSLNDLVFISPMRLRLSTYDQETPDWYEIIPQHKVGNFRIDFYITYHRLISRPSSYSKASVAVECDGHDYHERTKHQASHDKARDRFLTKNGISILRFTGSEIWKDPNKCAEEVAQYLLEKSKKIYLDINPHRSNECPSGVGGK